MSDDLSRRQLKTGETLYSQGDAGDCGYLIESGSLARYSGSGTSKQLHAIHYAGDFLGEMALLGQRIRTATAVAREDSQVLIVRRQDIDKRLSESDPLLREFLITILSDMRNMLISNWDVTKSSAEGLASAVRQLQDVESMMRGLEKSEFVLYYQPIVRLDNMKVAGVEALIRWNRPEYGFLPPAEFIPLAESSGAIVEIGRWVIEQACADMERLGINRMNEDAESKSPFVSVNLSGRQFSDPELAEKVGEAIQVHGLGPGQLKIEVTETELAQNIQAANELLLQFKLLGVTVALDDFGVGQSSLEYLHQFPADTLKLDRSFVSAIHQDHTALTIVSTVSRLAKELGMDTVAEGVESQELADTLQGLGIDYGQGYCFARPMPIEDLEVFLEEHGTI